MSMLNSTGPGIYLWDTPLVTGHKLDVVPLIATLNSIGSTLQMPNLKERILVQWAQTKKGRNMTLKYQPSYLQ